jgi:asparagine synthase (glutamine-hydrolysing)
MTASDAASESRKLPTPEPVEVLANLLLGRDPNAAALPQSPAAPVRDALENAMLPALRRSPCFVSFSGGRDSSAVLAVAVEVARRHGLPEPVPATMRFVDAPRPTRRSGSRWCSTTSGSSST